MQRRVLNLNLAESSSSSSSAAAAALLWILISHQ